MIVQLYSDDKLLWSSNYSEPITELTLSKELNKTDQLIFALPPTNTHMEDIKELSSYITLYEDDELVFEGRVIQHDEDFNHSITYTCEGSLAYLLDSIQRPKEYHDYSIRQYLEDKILNHNQQVEERKRFTVGLVDVTNSTDNAYRIDNDYPNTLTNISEKLVDRLGGYIRVRLDNGIRYIDYIPQYGGRSSQELRFRKNILDLTKFIDCNNVISRLIPLGANDEETGLPITIESVNEGKDYLESDIAVGLYGFITTIKTYDDITLPENLKKRAQEDLDNAIKESLTINLKAVDLSLLDADIDKISLGDSVHVVSEPHGIDDWFTVSIRKIDYLNPGESSVNMETVLTGISKVSADLASAVKKARDDLESEMARVPSIIQKQTEMILGGDGGYFYFKTNEQGVVEEIYCMDTDSTATTENCWRWNKNGIGVSHTGIDGPFISAWTYDGGFNATFLTSGTLDCDLVHVINLIANHVESENLEIYAGDMKLIKNDQLKAKVGIDDNNDHGQLIACLGNVTEDASDTDKLVLNDADARVTIIEGDTVKIGLHGTGTISDTTDANGSLYCGNIYGSSANITSITCGSITCSGTVRGSFVGNLQGNASTSDRADYATSAGSADSATNANYATSAGTADSASSATNANYASSAGYASNAGALNGVATVPLRGIIYNGNTIGTAQFEDVSGNKHICLCY